MYVLFFQLHWRFRRNGRLYEGYPYKTSRMWRGLPTNFTKIDTVYETKQSKIRFFIGTIALWKNAKLNINSPTIYRQPVLQFLGGRTRQRLTAAAHPARAARVADAHRRGARLGLQQSYVLLQRPPVLAPRRRNADHGA